MKYSSQYRKPDRSFTINNDPDLHPIIIKLPEPPNIKKITGYGLPAKDQMWKTDPLPPKLVKLQENTAFETIEDIWEELENDQEFYADEIKYIETQWDRRKNGYWFFNNGMPTYIAGNHYFHLNSWEMDIGLPEYRDRDRKWWHTVNQFHKDPRCLGVNYPKHRREGATNRTQCWMYELISRTKGAHGGIQSMTEEHAQQGVFADHLVTGWRSLPFFFQPIHEGTTNPKKALRFFAPARKAYGGSLRSIRGSALNSYIDFKPANVNAYDTFKLIAFHNDECGKTTEVKITERHNVVRQCMSLGAGKKLVGFCVNTSTVGEMTKKGGEDFKKLCDQSHYNNRTKNKQTLSGLYNFFMPANEGLEGFIDKYGNSVTVTAELHIKNMLQAYREAGDMDGYNEFARQHPMTFRSCFRGAAKNCNFNAVILSERLEKFAFGNKYLVRGNFKWENDVRETRVYWSPDPQGKFQVSHLLTPHESNLQVWDGEVRLPNNITRFIAGGDPFKFRKTMGSIKSKGAGAVFQKHDISIDLPDKPINEWKSNRFCCTYEKRTMTKDAYGEDMIMMCVYYGCEMNCEINVDFLWDYFEARGYAGYLYYGVDRKTGRLKATPGTNTSAVIQDDIYREYHTYIERHGPRECHEDLLLQCQDIEDDMGPFDLFVAGGLALLGNKKVSFQQEATQKMDLGLYIPTYTIRN